MCSEITLTNSLELPDQNLPNTQNQTAISQQFQPLLPSHDLANLATALFGDLDISPSTRYDYEQRTPIFLDFISRSGLTRNSYLEFKRYLAGRVDYSVATKAKYLSVAKVVLKELNRQGYLPTDITSTIKGFKQSKKHKRDGINDDEMSRLMQAVRQLPVNPSSDRMKAILSLLTLQGIRQIEIVRLSVSDIDLVANTALMLGKGRDDKEIIDLHPETSKSLAQYMKSNGIKSGALFVSQSNNSRNQRLSTRSVRELVTRLLIDLAITKTVHGFRHYFTTKLIEAYKGDLLEVTHYTRHKSLEMLQVYNDAIRRKADLPRYYDTFSNFKL